MNLHQALALVVLVGCSSTQVVDDPSVITRAEFAQLKWLEGTWRGSGTDQGAFYERYRFANDSTLIVESFSDSTLQRVTETATYVLSEGKLGNVLLEVRAQC